MYFAGFDSEHYLSTHKSALLSHFKFFVSSEKTSVPKFYAANILKLLCAHYVKGERWFMLGNAFVDEDGSTALTRESVELEYLHYELGIDMELLWDKLGQAVACNHQLLDI